MSRGSTFETLDGIKMSFFEKLSRDLKNGSFNFSPTRRIMIPKGPGKTGERPLSIASPREKIVQKAVALILENIFEPIFLDSSHGFRPNRGTHSALKQIHSRTLNYKWAINGDISKCFDKIPLEVILALISRKIGCHRTLELINKALTNPSVINGRLIPSSIGTPQGSIMSPVISNIVLHELDLFLLKIKENFDTGARRRVNPKYHSLSSSRFKTSNSDLKKTNLMKMMKMEATDSMDPNFKRLLYVRYADDFVVLVIGSQTDCFDLRRKIKDFLNNKLKLELNIEKTDITNVKEGFIFLGAHIIQRSKILLKVANSNIRRRFSRRISVLAPLTKMLDKFILAGFARKNPQNKIFARGRRDLVNQTHYDILSFYNSKINGLINFYSFAGNFDQIRRIL